ncbi:MAG: triose-phosphate isomerase [Steroidobacteraceae bacterium]
MPRPIVAGNWKLNGSRTANRELIERILAGQAPSDSAECVICPPFVYLADLARALAGSGIALGAQDVCAEAAGAFTGEVSAAMLSDVGATWAIVGHSERRSLYGETDELVARKFSAAQGQGLTPILCVGEQLQERERGATTEVVGRQLDAVLQLAGVASFAAAVIAYEPVWAIGTGVTATPAQAEDVHAFIRERLRRQDAKIAADVRILYGGSVKAANAAELFAQPNVNGGLIGGASLNAEEFLAILGAANG